MPPSHIHKNDGAFLRIAQITYKNPPVCMVCHAWYFSASFRQKHYFGSPWQAL